jgi:hypothetical protein
MQCNESPLWWALPQKTFVRGQGLGQPRGGLKLVFVVRIDVQNSGS